MNDLIDSGIWAKLSCAARALYPVLCRYSNETFEHVWPGTDRLLEQTGFKTKKSLQAAKKELHQAGLIDFIPGTGRTPSRYYFRFDYPGSKIKLNELRDNTISRRGLSAYPPGGPKNIPQGGHPGAPNEINININHNQYSKEQERLLGNIQGLLEKFIEDAPANRQGEYREQIINTMLEKYGNPEVGEAIKIAIERGKNGDIRYLEGILRNRKNDKFNKPAKKIDLSKDVLISNKNLFSSEFATIIEKAEFRYNFEGINYYSIPSDIPVGACKQLETEALSLGLRIKMHRNAKAGYPDNVVSLKNAPLKIKVR